jgi:hypothetical protein
MAASRLLLRRRRPTWPPAARIPLPRRGVRPAALTVPSSSSSLKVSTFFLLPFSRACSVLGSDFDSIFLQVTIVFRWCPGRGGVLPCMVVPSGVAMVVLHASTGAHAAVHYDMLYHGAPHRKVPSQSHTIFPRRRHVFTCRLRSTNESCFYIQSRLRF